MADDKRALIAEALRELVEEARSGVPCQRIGIMAYGSELGQAELLQGAILGQRQTAGLAVVAIGPKPQGQEWKAEYANLEWIETPACEADIVNAMETALRDGKIGGAVALHYPFPVGVATIGRVLTPGRGRPLLLASSTGATATLRTEAMVRNAVYGLAVAKALGNTEPSLGFLNLDGAAPAMRALTRMTEKGYKMSFGSSAREGGGALLRGNDAVSGSVDVMACDTLTGNALTKVFAAYSTGGNYESVGWGYGPSVGEGWNHVVSIISRASGTQVIANALGMTAQLVRNDLPALVRAELTAAKKAGLDAAIADLQPKIQQAESVACPPATPVDAEIHGVDVLDMDVAVQVAWKAGIYAETAMGCTGPVIKLASANKENVTALLCNAGYL